MNEQITKDLDFLIRSHNDKYKRINMQTINDIKERIFNEYESEGKNHEIFRIMENDLNDLKKFYYKKMNNRDVSFEVGVSSKVWPHNSDLNMANNLLLKEFYNENYFKNGSNDEEGKVFDEMVETIINKYDPAYFYPIPYGIINLYLINQKTFNKKRRKWIVKNMTYLLLNLIGLDMKSYKQYKSGEKVNQEIIEIKLSKK